MGLDAEGLDQSTSLIVTRAAVGEKQAQYELGLRFAHGDGVPRDCEKARRLLRQAATRSGGTIWVYTPSVTKGGKGRVIPIDSGPVQLGLPAAERALETQNLC